MNQISEVKNFVSEFYHAYYNKEYGRITDMFSDSGMWSGIHTEKTVAGKRQLVEFLEKLKRQQQFFSYTIQDLDLEADSIGERFYLVNAKYRLITAKEGKEAKELPVFGSLLLETGSPFQIHQAFFSLIGTERYYSEFYEQTLKSQENQALKQIIKQANQNIETLYNSVPGGIFKCLYDDNLTLLEMSEGFLNMIGYTKEEVFGELKGSLRVLIQPDDLIEAVRVMEGQLKRGNTKEIQYRLIHKDGHFINVLDKGTLLEDEQGRASFYCIVVDVTKEKEMEEELRLSLGRHKIITNQTNDVIFEWDMVKDSFLVSSNWEKKFGRRRLTDGFSIHELIKPGDGSPFMEADFSVIEECIRDIKAGKTYMEKELRIRNVDGKFIWCRMRTTLQFDKKGTPIKVIGVIVDIDRERRQSLTLKKRAEQDALTGLFNKEATHSRIREYMEEGNGTGALMIIDIDNFKRVNDTKGHLYGDAVLSNLSRSMKNSFRESDILGRIGGDEFLIFLKSVDRHEYVQINAEKILKLFSELQVNGRLTEELSCSIGVAMYPGDGSDFTTLFQNADYALYHAKHEGKNRYAFYDEKSVQSYIRNQAFLEPVANTKIDSNDNGHMLNTQIVEYVFRILYNNRDDNETIGAILEIVGNYFNVSRSYIFENSEDSRYCINTFEWCNKGVEPQIHSLKKVSYEEDLGGSYQKNFNEENVFYCQDITKLPRKQYEILERQNIKSMLQCAITDRGEFKGFVGFDECRQNRLWTKDQIDVLAFVSEILSTFLLKRRANENYRMENEGLLSILDNQDSWIYVIEPETRELLFINRKARQAAPGSELGMHCYDVFMQKDQPCEGCPADSIGEDCKNRTVEFYNPGLDIWSSANAAEIVWKGKRAILLTCRDITKLKKALEVKKE